MRARPSMVVFVVVVALVAGFELSGRAARQAQPPSPQQVPTFRAGTILVPVDVRVLDDAGKPVIDLKQEDFTILEGGVIQRLGHFSLQQFEADPSQAGQRLRIREQALSLAPQNRRVFLLLLGRGRLQEPSKALDALIGFVRAGLLPQDQVAVFAYDRASDFTTDHAAVAALLERFKKEHVEIDHEIGLEMQGLAAVYGSKAIPRKLQEKIDKLFGDTLTARPMAEGVSPTGEQIGRDMRKQGDSLMGKGLEDARRALEKDTGLPSSSVWTNLHELETTMFSDLPFDGFVENTARTLLDLGNILAAIEYLRHFEGEKHLVFVTEKGVMLPRVEDDEMVTSLANDARVAIDTIQTGGIYRGQPGGVAVATWDQTFAFDTLRRLARETGGVSSIADPGQLAVDRLNQATRASYLLAYYPARTMWDGKYRKITVRVNRPGVTVLARQGYYGRPAVTAFNRRDFIATDRISAAMKLDREINDIKLELKPSLVKPEDGSGRELVVELKVNASRLSFKTDANGSQLAFLDVAIVCADQKGGILGNTLQKADLTFKPEEFEKIKKEGIPLRFTMVTGASARRVRVVVYDFGADLIGSKDGRVW